MYLDSLEVPQEPRSDRCHDVLMAKIGYVRVGKEAHLERSNPKSVIAILFSMFEYLSVCTWFSLGCRRSRYVTMS